MPINYLLGDATEPQSDHPFAIIHINNNLGAWGGGFVLAVSEKWIEPEVEYRRAIQKQEIELGDIQIVPIEDFAVVVNMVAQDGFPTDKRPCAIDYEALAECLRKIAKRLPPQYSINLPRIGTGIGGGDWNVIEEILNNELADYEINVYDMPGTKFAPIVE